MLLDDEKEINNEQEDVNVPAEETVETPVAAVEPEEVVAEAVVETPVAVAEPEVVAEAVVETPVAAVEPEVVAEAVVETPVAVEPEVVAEAVVETPVAVAEPEVVVEAAVETPVAEEEPEVVAEEEEEPAPAAKEEEPVVEEEEEELVLPEFETVVAGGAHDDFNWLMDKRGAIAYTPADKTALLKQYDETLKSVTENEIIRGRVSAISGGDVVLDINYKSDGLIPLSEFRDTPGLAQGDEEIGRAHV